VVNKDQVVGMAKQVKGSVKQAAGKAAGNKRTQVEGMADKVAGKVQKTYGDMKTKSGKRSDPTPRYHLTGHEKAAHDAAFFTCAISYGRRW
jgi:uncharacterized protein YjbJ (UPF0337 family)